MTARVQVVAPSDHREGEAARSAGQAPGHPAAVPAPPASLERVLAQPGQPLGDGPRQDMERRLGHDLSAVRVHADAGAGDSARALRAAAYTVGNDVVFAPGRYAPGTPAGRQLLAHELTHVARHSHPAAGEGAVRPLFRQPEEDDPAAEARRAVRDTVASLWAIPLVIGDDPPELIRWATARAASLESDDTTQAERVYSARGLVRAYEDLKALERRAPRADDGALEYSYYGDLAPWSQDRPHTVEDIAPFTPGSVRQWRALGSLEPDAAPGRSAAVRGGGARGNPAPAQPASPARPVRAGRRAAPVKLAHTITFTKPAGLDADSEEGQREIEALIIRAMYPAMDDLLLSWVVTKLGTKLPVGGSRFTEAWLNTFKEAKDGARVEITGDEALTFEVDELVRTAPDRIALIGREVHRGTVGIYYIVGIEFAAALIAFTGGAALGIEAGGVGASSAAAGAEGGVAAADVGGGVAAADAGAGASQSFAAIARSGLASWGRSAYLGAPSVYQWGMATLAAGAGAQQLGAVWERGLHNLDDWADLFGALASFGEAYVMMPRSASPGSTALAPPRKPTLNNPEFTVDEPYFDQATGMARTTIRQVRTGDTREVEVHPLTGAGQVTDPKTGEVVARFWPAGPVPRGGTPAGTGPPATEPLGLPAPSGSTPQAAPTPPAPELPATGLPASPDAMPASRAGAPSGRSFTGARMPSPDHEEDYAGSARPVRLAGGPFYARPPAGSRGPAGTPAVRPPRAPAVRPSRAPAVGPPAVPARRPATPPASQPAAPATRPARTPATRQPAAPAARQPTVPDDVPSWNDIGFRRRALARPRGQRIPLLSLAPRTADPNQRVELVLADVDPRELQASFGGGQVYVWRSGSRILYVGKSGGEGGEVIEPGTPSPKPTNWVTRATADHLQHKPDLAAADSVTVHYDLTMDYENALETEYIRDQANPPELNRRRGDFTENYGEGSPDYAENLKHAQRSPQVTFWIARITPSPNSFLP
jgi:hypothetical protein